VHFTSNDGQATLPANYTFTAGDAGVHTFSVTLKTVGTTRVITATDTVTAITGTLSGISVNPAAASTFTVSGFPSPSTAGVAGNATVTAKDAYGNTATGYLGTVHFTSTDAQASLPIDYTFSSGDAGGHVFSVTLKTAGTRSITATDKVTSTITGAQTGIIVNPAAASTLALSGFPSPSTAGAGHTLTVTARDPFGNTATGYRGTVHLTSSDGQATLPGNYTFTSGDAGVHGFSVSLKTAGTQSITATDTATSTITGTQSGITVNPASAASIRISAPTSVSHSVQFSFTVTIVDAFGNVATGYRGTVHFTSSDNSATLPGNYTFTSNDAGVHTFTATLRKTGNRTLTATDTANGSITGTQSIQVVMSDVPLLPDLILDEDTSDFGDDLLPGEQAIVEVAAFSAKAPMSELNAEADGMLALLNDVSARQGQDLTPMRALDRVYAEAGAVDEDGDAGPPVAASSPAIAVAVLAAATLGVRPHQARQEARNKRPWSWLLPRRHSGS
jgi:hypothetical protein